MSAPSPVLAMLLAGGARAGATGLAVLRTKLVALLLGPEGVGLMGLYASLQEIGAQAADGGLSHSAVREVARTRGDPVALAHLRRALAWAVLALGAVAAAALWTWRGEIAFALTGSGEHAAAFGLLGAGVAAMMVWRWQQAVLAGFQSVADLARLTLTAAAIATAGGLAAIWQMGTEGVVWAVLLGPVAGAALGAAALARLPRTRVAPDLAAIWRAWRGLFGLGAGLMVSALAVLVTPMVLRVWLSHDAGLEAAGLYHAALIVAMHATGLLMAAVGMDYYPRISAAIGTKAASGIAEAQIRLHLRVGAPVLILLTAGASWVMVLLYAAPFAVAAGLMQMLLLATLLRLVAVPVELCLTASGRSGLILRLQLLHQGLALGLGLAAWPWLGLWGLGLGAVIGQAVHLVCLARAVRARCRLRLDWRRLARPLAIALALAVAVQALERIAPMTATAAGVAAAAGWAVIALRWPGARARAMRPAGQISSRTWA